MAPKINFQKWRKKSEIEKFPLETMENIECEVILILGNFSNGGLIFQFRPQKNFFLEFGEKIKGC